MDRDSDEENYSPEATPGHASATNSYYTSRNTSNSYPTDKLLRHMQLQYERPKNLLREPVSSTMNKDGCYTYVHMHASMHADLLEDFCKDKLPADDVYVPPHMQPINPEDEDDVVPDQHAAFGIQKATQKTKEPAWKDLGLAELMRKGPGAAPPPGKRKKVVKGRGLPR